MSNPKRILPYAAPPLPKPKLSLFGAIVCAIGTLCGLAVTGYGIWWIVMTDGAEIPNGAGIALTGALITGLCIRWFFKAKIARIVEDKRPF